MVVPGRTPRPWRLARRPACCGAALVALLALVPGLAGGCKTGPAESPAEQQARAIMFTDARLRGAWTLQTFEPAAPLEPALQGLLNLQLGRLVARFDGKRMVADSMGIHVDRAYQVSDVVGDQFRLTTFDAQGVPSDALCNFRDATTIDVSSASPPFRGHAVITRGAPPAQPSPW